MAWGLAHHTLWEALFSLWTPVSHPYKGDQNAPQLPPGLWGCGQGMRCGLTVEMRSSSRSRVALPLSLTPGTSPLLPHQSNRFPTLGFSLGPP